MHEKRYDRILNAIYQSPWAIQPDKLEVIIQVVRSHAAGNWDFEREAQFAESAEAAAASNGSRRAGSIAVLPLFGTIAQRMDLMTAFSGGTSTEQFSKSLRAALDDPSVDAVVIDIDSPGGSVYGVPELASEIFQARARKKIAAIADSLAASAAYWIGSAAHSLSVTPSGEVGSIGVFAAHQDFSAYDEKAGVKTTLISAGKYKTEGNEFEPLSNDARAALQLRVDQYYDMFVKAVARGRGETQKAVREGYGEGRVLGAEDALKAGMVDRIETLDQLLARLGGKSTASKSRAQEGERQRKRLQLAIA